MAVEATVTFPGPIDLQGYRVYNPHKTQGLILREQTIVTAEQIKIMDRTIPNAVKVVPEPGMGLMLSFVGAVMQFKYIAPAYTGGSSLVLLIGDAVESVPVSGAGDKYFMTGDKDQILAPWNTPANNGYGSKSIYENKPIYLALNAATKFATGNGTLSVMVFYLTVAIV